MISEPLKNPLSLFDVKGKSALITGASGAFGRAVAIALSSLGAKLTLVAGNNEELQSVAQECRSVGGEVQTINRRPDSLDDANAMINAAVEAYGSIELMFIGSGYNKAGFIHEQDYEDWQAVMDANVRGNWFMAKAYGTWRIENKLKGGKVVMVSSVRGRHGNISGYTGYCTSKGATDMLTKVLATEWGQHGINVNAIAPTVFRSKLTAWMFDEDNELGQATKQRSLSRLPLGRLGEAEDLVGMAIYLLSPASNFCTGQIMYVDGGFTAG
ncbi:SDR family NAD(P)-dependent oxidoreductase [Paraglaciecola chathamensis]|jgi:NAD(P)-dependent dehydrogenase (short-subunit alcohol dehydrogenase family)|uniref:Oxidoreductase n=2 Tax=Paraglaciecola chathamensis TaxID=368405 RepID=A0ABQ0IDG1_9ALTE|nr:MULTISPECIES: SDR family oxidoreductase [Paraglaciecola]MBN26118.1 oxidoreductase [Alteromonadaceae bacterium]GAC07431.1 oxidoreductase [Paraglaciecola agarilytica NO2]GAC10888.1 oxidoreductase [Paraglaciecola chathamensis S18K6]|tara:strand:- start:39942 stop:40751 length:810 start_codon:yes stop_codon:yes gene_type:complete